MGHTPHPSIVPPPGPDAHRHAPAVPQPWEKADRAQAALDGATGPEPPGPPRCPHCGLTGERRPTYTGQHVLLEPRLVVPSHLVPGGHRWHVDRTGVAWNGGLNEPRTGETCRIPHQLACPGLTLDELKPWRWLTSVRDHNAALARQRADAEGVPDTWPDAG
ncbi:DUF6083 domain-containing protein [Streptomyces sp. JB150]|uniref:DUF6083 domain-containing protein n=1 Tax=Streptomyces sp. JB150 TaxID=2714844 RepID=UPI00140AC7C5|nr:DUF6083 domain-containing protein [Streptomyces sp. JB150]QIJ60792.1 hypothetical protein G7Z13_01125 [Streptomyces sp. JB150]